MAQHQPLHELPEDVEANEGDMQQQLRRLSDASQPAPPYQDVVWAVLFILQLLATIILTIVYSTKVKTGSTSYHASEWTKNLFGACGFSIAVGAAFVGVWILALRRWPYAMVYVGIFGVTAVSLAFSIIGFVYANTSMGVTYLIVAVLSALYYYLVRARIPFAQAMLAGVSKAIVDTPAPIAVVYGMLVVQVVYICMMVYLYVCTLIVDGFSYAWLFLLWAALAWTTHVIRTVGLAASCGAIAAWWFIPGSRDPTLAALKRTMTTSFGSICLGSITVMCLSVGRLAVAMFTSWNCLRCVMRWLQRIVEYFNLYAFVQVATYGKPFCAAAKDTIALFKARGLTLIINDTLIGAVINLGCLVGAFIAAGIGALWGSQVTLDVGRIDRTVSVLLFFIVTLYIALLTAIVGMSVIRGAVATTFVAWAQDPETLNVTHPAEFTAITAAAAKVFNVAPAPAPAAAAYRPPAAANPGVVNPGYGYAPVHAPPPSGHAQVYQPSNGYYAYAPAPVASAPANAYYAPAPGAGAAANAYYAPAPGAGAAAPNPFGAPVQQFQPVQQQPGYYPTLPPNPSNSTNQPSAPRM